MDLDKVNKVIQKINTTRVDNKGLPKDMSRLYKSSIHTRQVQAQAKNAKTQIKIAQNTPRHLMYTIQEASDTTCTEGCKSISEIQGSRRLTRYNAQRRCKWNQVGYKALDDAPNMTLREHVSCTRSLQGTILVYEIQWCIEYPEGSMVDNRSL